MELAVVAEADPLTRITDEVAATAARTRLATPKRHQREPSAQRLRLRLHLKRPHVAHRIAWEAALVGIDFAVRFWDLVDGDAAFTGSGVAHDVEEGATKTDP